MCRIDKHRWLPAFVVFAALVMEPFAIPCQAPTQAPAVATQPPVSITTPQFQPTAEELGDSLMMHQRYQAAIET